MPSKINLSLCFDLTSLLKKYHYYTAFSNKKNWEILIMKKSTTFKIKIFSEPKS